MLNVFSHRAIQDLYEAARSILDKGQPPDVLRGPLDELERLARFRDSVPGQDILRRTRDCYSYLSDDIEIDDGGLIDENGTGGFWVTAWCYIEANDPAESPLDLTSDADVPLSVIDRPKAG